MSQDHTDKHTRAFHDIPDAADMPEKPKPHAIGTATRDIKAGEVIEITMSERGDLNCTAIEFNDNGRLWVAQQTIGYMKNMLQREAKNQEV